MPLSTVQTGDGPDRLTDFGGVPVSGRGLMLTLSFLEHELERVDVDDFTLDEIERLSDLMLPIISKLACTVSDSLDRYQARRAAFEAVLPVLCSAGFAR